MALGKKECRLIGDLNRLYDKNYTLLQDSGGSQEIIKKLKLIRNISKNIEEQGRGFLKTNLRYKEAGGFLVENCFNMDYDELFQGVKDILLNPT